VSMLSRDWGFSLDEIETPTEIWHGELDTIVPPSMARKMAAAIPGCRAHYLPGSGHCLLFHCWRQILSAAIADKETSKRKQRRIENA
jgi:pimeloyl-ACP methyl ester carboxylesterase